MESNSLSKMPHVGNILQEAMNEKRYTNVQLANSIGVAPMTVWRLVRQQSIQADMLWRIGKVLQINLLQRIANHHPIQTPTQKELELEKQIIALQAKIDLYKELLSK